MLCVCRLTLESHDQPGEAAVLRGAGSAQQAAPGKIPRLQVQATAQTHLPGGRQEAAHRRVQGHHEVPQAGNETVLQCGVSGLAFFVCLLFFFPVRKQGLTITLFGHVFDFVLHILNELLFLFLCFPVTSNA